MHLHKYDNIDNNSTVVRLSLKVIRIFRKILF